MKLLDVRLRPSSAVIQSCLGSFTAAGKEELLLIKPGGTLELHAIVTTTSNNTAEDDDEEDEPRTHLKLVSRVETKSVLRSCSVLRFQGEQRDVAILGSDSGSVSVLEFSAADGGSSSGASGPCQILHCTEFGKSGCRRATPGQYVASDPKGRAMMVAAVEKRKLVYVLNRDAAGKPTIASPLEANRGRAITLATVGVDNGFDNPIFASLEMQYEDEYEASSNQEKSDDNDDDDENGSKVETQLAYYELDLGLNHVSRKWASTTLSGACCLAALPGVADGGPGGVLVGAEDWLEYLHDSVDNPDQQASKRICCAVPRRRLHPKERSILVTHITVHRQKKSRFFALAQTELGDLFKITIHLDPEASDTPTVIGLEAALLDTLPPASSLNVSKMGFLFAAVETGDHYLYQFQRFDLPDAPKCLTQDCQEGLKDIQGSSNLSLSAFRSAATKVAPVFDPTDLKNLRKVHTLENSAPCTGIMIGELAGDEVSPQVYLMSGRGPTSSMKIIRHGVSVTELAVSDLPGVPGGIFTVSDNSSKEGGGTAARSDRFIVVSFADATLVLSVGDSVEEVGKESRFLTNSPTLACSALGDDGALVQVHPSGVRHILPNSVKAWHCPGLKRIECASANQYQVIIALAGGEVNYFELDDVSQTLKESPSKDLKADVCCLDVGTISVGRSRSLFAAVGCRDQTVRILSLQPDKILAQLSSIALKSRPQSVSLVKWNSKSGEELDLVIGLDDGSTLRSTVDGVTGAIGTSTTTRFLGTRPVSVSTTTVGSNVATLFLSSRPWVGRHDESSGKYIMAPLSYVPLDHGCSFSSDMIREGIVATAGNTLRILSIDSSAVEGGEDEAFNSQRVKLQYAPRQMTLLSLSPDASSPNTNVRKVVIAVAESDHNEYSLEAKKAMGLNSEGLFNASKKDDGDAMDMDDDSDNEGEKKAEEGDDEEEDEDEKESKRTVIRGPIPSGKGNWGSCVRILDPANNCSTLDCVEMGRNEAALCCASVRFHSKGRESFLAVGVVAGLTTHPLKQEGSYILLYRIVTGGKLKLLHRTTVDGGPILALAHFEGRLLAGIGNSLRLYELGKRQLLRKCELRGLPTYVKTLQTVGDRAFVGDMIQSIRIVLYEASANKLVVIAGDPCPRMIVCQEMLDWNTVAIGDKFGCISILRLPEAAETNALDLSATGSLWDSTKADLTPRLELMAQYYVGEVVTGITRSALVAGGSDSLIYVTVSGRIASLVPLASRDDVDFYEQLESALRTQAPRPTGRDPKAYRSYYAPTMHVIDGDLCDAFNGLPNGTQAGVAEAVGREIGSIKKKLEDTRNALL